MTLEYTKNWVDELLKGFNAIYKADLIGHGYYFYDDKETRDIYQITFKRNGKTWTFRYGQSINHSGGLQLEKRIKEARSQAPSAYDVLSTIQKYDPGDFEEFCGEFGYPVDSITATDIYKAVQKEYRKFISMFGDVQDIMQEIQ